MKEYPSILGLDGAPELPCIAFRKYDGSNLRFAWARGQGWWQFGTRRRLFDATDPEFGGAIELFRAKYAAGVEKVILCLVRVEQPAGFVHGGPPVGSVMTSILYPDNGQNDSLRVRAVVPSPEVRPVAVRHGAEGRTKIVLRESSGVQDVKPGSALPS